ncbi:undecaprenyl-diphosphate phosphatase [Niveibacterium sp. SC-1]|uniref:undecaprenyl-diphosphate phosphatase n=1 Tax=Niveibacterium sp. SC-1 TaxID=3135646 RepID=UPI00311FE891
METLLVIKAVILGILEGLTEFLPVSSTGHLIIAEDLLNFNDARAKVFAIAIQLGAVIAVVSIYRQRITQVITGLGRDPLANRLAINVIAAFLPAMVLGLAFHHQIKTLLFNPITVATMLIVGGFVILWAERREHSARMHTLDEIGPLDALKVGFCQALAMIPGTSRSGATIIGGMFCGLSRETATQFSFFLAMPTMLAATVYDLYKSRADLAFDSLGLIAIGFVAAFLAALATVRFMLGFVSKHAFTPFAWYRIAFGLIVLASWYFGWVNWSEPALA